MAGSVISDGSGSQRLTADTCSQLSTSKGRLL